MIAENLTKIRAQIIMAEQQFGRPLNSVNLLAVSKTQPITAISAAYEAGQRLFGENYLQEALTKMAALKHLAIEWHFIGAIQSNKTRALATHFAWIHSISRYKIAQRLNDQRPLSLPPLNICIEVNINDEPQKSGVSLHELPLLVQQISQLPQLKLRGLMAIPEITEDLSTQRAIFNKLKRAFLELQQQGFSLDTLSIGMSHDYAAAIAEGATIVRIGTAIFGERLKVNG